MHIYNLILQRRSIRRFTQEPLPLNTLSCLVDAARVAPSAANLQPLEYIIVDKPKQAAQVFSTLKWAGYIRPQGDPPAGEHPTAYIVVLTNSQIKSNGYNQDAGAAIENMILAALEEGIGSCWLESIDKDALRKILALPEHLIINAVLALGYPKERPLMEELSKPEDSIEYWKDEQGCLHVPKRRLENILHYNQYNQACPGPNNSNHKWVLVLETSVEEEAHLVKGFLESNGIPCIMEMVKFHEMPVNFGPMSKVRLLVPEDKLKEGQELIASCDKDSNED